MGNPRETGISSITGKVLYIRHANESERIDIAEILKKRAGWSLDVSEGDAAVASQEDRLLGFAVLSNDSLPAGLVANACVAFITDVFGYSPYLPVC